MKWYHQDTNPIVLIIAAILSVVLLIGLWVLADTAAENFASRRIQLMEACDNGQMSACALLVTEY